MGPSFPLDLSTLPIRSEEIPLQYPLLKLGYSRIITGPTIEERKAAGRKIEQTLRGEKEAAPAPTED
ncbi:DOPA 4,5-dioxygenase [Rhizoctonia solani AG-1 IB]|nr:DOPA 4,5-dioxygenase [Rhizoctonia solani AG-1 IB]